jgi:hypothetical protein
VKSGPFYAVWVTGLIDEKKISFVNKINLAYNKAVMIVRREK